MANIAYAAYAPDAGIERREDGLVYRKGVNWRESACWVDFWRGERPKPGMVTVLASGKDDAKLDDAQVRTLKMFAAWMNLWNFNASVVVSKDYKRKPDRDGFYGGQAVDIADGAALYGIEFEYTADMDSRTLFLLLCMIRYASSEFVYGKMPGDATPRELFEYVFAKQDWQALHLPFQDNRMPLRGQMNKEPKRASPEFGRAFYHYHVYLLNRIKTDWTRKNATSAGADRTCQLRSEDFYEWWDNVYAPNQAAHDNNAMFEVPDGIALAPVAAEMIDGGKGKKKQEKKLAPRPVMVQAPVDANAFDDIDGDEDEDDEGNDPVDAFGDDDAFAELDGIGAVADDPALNAMVDDILGQGLHGQLADAREGVVMDLIDIHDRPIKVHIVKDLADNAIGIAVGGVWMGMRVRVRGDGRIEPVVLGIRAQANAAEAVVQPPQPAVNHEAARREKDDDYIRRKLYGVRDDVANMLVNPGEVDVPRQANERERQMIAEERDIYRRRIDELMDQLVNVARLHNGAKRRLAGHELAEVRKRQADRQAELERAQAQARREMQERAEAEQQRIAQAQREQAERAARAEQGRLQREAAVQPKQKRNKADDLREAQERIEAAKRMVVQLPPMNEGRNLRDVMNERKPQG